MSDVIINKLQYKSQNHSNQGPYYKMGSELAHPYTQEREKAARYNQQRDQDRPTMKKSQ